MRRPGTAATVLGLHLGVLAAAWHAGLAPGAGPAAPPARAGVLQVVLAPLPAPLPAPVPLPPSVTKNAPTLAPPPAAPQLPLPAVALAAPTAMAIPVPSTAALTPAVPAPAPAAAPAAAMAAAVAASPAAPLAAAPAATSTAAAPEPVQQAQVRREACPPATHPAALRERGIEGEVRLLVRVGADGRAAEVKLQQPSGWRLFDQAALAQAQACRFVPARRGAQTEESWVEFPVRFSLQG